MDWRGPSPPLKENTFYKVYGSSQPHLSFHSTSLERRLHRGRLFSTRAQSKISQICLSQELGLGINHVKFNALSKNTFVHSCPPDSCTLSMTTCGNGCSPCIMYTWIGTVLVSAAMNGGMITRRPSSLSFKSSVSSPPLESSLEGPKKSPVANTISNLPCF
jgi:hypothetical protein